MYGEWKSINEKPESNPPMMVPVILCVQLLNRKESIHGYYNSIRNEYTDKDFFIIDQVIGWMPLPEPIK